MNKLRTLSEIISNTHTHTQRQLREAGQHHTKTTWTTYNAHNYVNTNTAVAIADFLFFQEHAFVMVACGVIGVITVLVTIHL